MRFDAIQALILSRDRLQAAKEAKADHDDDDDLDLDGSTPKKRSTKVRL